MQKKIFKNGFSLAETLLAIGIIGIIATVTFNSYNPRENARRYQVANAYKTLSTAYYNGLLNGINPFSKEETISFVEGRNTPVRDNNRKNILCYNLSHYINVTEMSQVMLNFNFDTGACGANDFRTAADLDGSNVVGDSQIEPAFIARGSNMAFWISNMFAGDNGENNPIEFMMVFVDVDGLDRGPNSFNSTRRNPADRVAFAVFDSGRITPIGRLEWDPRLLTARVGTFDDSGREELQNQSMPFFEAKARAWGYYNGGIANSVTTFDTTDPNTLNDYVRSKLGNNSPVLEGFPNLATNLTVFANGNCSNNDFGACFIHVDQYSW